MKHLISITDLTKEEIVKIFQFTFKLKQKPKKFSRMLTGKTLAMIFQKPSTRTRVSFEVAMTQLGGVAIFLSSQELQLKRGESIADTARTLSRYVNVVMIRTSNHKDIIEFAKYSTVPVINGLSDLEHPCQVLGDIYTIVEKKLAAEKILVGGKLNSVKEFKITFIGDGNNVANSWLLAAATLGMRLVICTPEGFAPNKEIFQKSQEIGKLTRAEITLSNDPITSVNGSDIIYTDVWTSMGKEEESQMRKQVFNKYQVNKELVRHAKPNALIMHCLPARRGEEITDEIIDAPNSIVFDQAENRLYVQKAILVHLLG
ncbi:MAG: ornithine carbamoyltransferase [Elusimicrobiota bacterium]|nr:ornithine carbamoyltransferase [Elusimicrobiota bacterium]